MQTPLILDIRLKSYEQFINTQNNVKQKDLNSFFANISIAISATPDSRPWSCHIYFNELHCVWIGWINWKVINDWALSYFHRAVLFLWYKSHYKILIIPRRSGSWKETHVAIETSMVLIWTLPCSVRLSISVQQHQCWDQCDCSILQYGTFLSCLY